MNKKSFTLIELLVVIAIIGILSSLVIARFSDWGDNARIANTLQWSAGVHRTLGANLVGHWPLDGNLNDISGYGNHGLWKGTDTNAPSGNWIDGVPGTGTQAIDFQNNNEWFLIPDGVASRIHGKTESSISLWIKKDYIQYGFLQLSGYVSANGCLYPYDTETKVYIDTFKTSRFGPIYMDTSVLNWHHLAISTTPGSNGYRIYQNGLLVYQATGESTVSTNYLDFTIGVNSSSRYMNGRVSDVRLYNTALTAEEVSRIYAETKDSYLAYE